MTGREYVLALSEAVKAARELRHEPDETFDDLTVEELGIVARGLHAVSYSAQVGSRKLERLAAKRAEAS